MMLDAFGSGRVYQMNPDKHREYQAGIQATPEFAETAYLTFEPGFINDLSAETIASMFIDYGDFYAYKGTENSCFFEFFFVDGTHVPDQTLKTFIEVVLRDKKLQVVSGCLHKDAPRFKAHNRIDEI
jgi:hypothetical protein